MRSVYLEKQFMALVLACLVLFAIQYASQATAAPDNVCDSVTLTTQSQIDAFDQNCEIIDGYLKIDGGADGGNIADLTPLNNVQAAYSLVIFNTNKLTNLKGLEGLASVTQCVLIQENEGLVSLTGMESLKSIGGAALNYGVSQCSNLGLLVRWNELLTDLDGLKNLNSLAGNLDLYNNDQMTSIAGLGALQNVELSDLAIWDNKRLPNLAGLEGLRSANTLLIRYNQNLSHVDALRNLVSTWSSSVGVRFTVEENWSLGRCEGLAPFFQWPGQSFDRSLASFEDNDSGCETLDELWASVVVTGLGELSAQASNGRMLLDYLPSTSNSPLYPVNGHAVACSFFDADNLTFPLRPIGDGQTITESHFFSSGLRPARAGYHSELITAWSPTFKLWHPSPDELTAILTTPWGEEIEMLNRLDIQSDADNFLVYPEGVAGISGFYELENNLEGNYQIEITDSIATAASGRLNYWGIRAGSGLHPYGLAQTTPVMFDTVLNDVDYVCDVRPSISRLNTRSFQKSIEFRSQLTLPVYEPEILSIRSDAGVEASIIVEFSQPQAWGYEIQDYLVTCEADGADPAYGSATADNAVVGIAMGPEGRVTQTVVVEGVNEEQAYSCFVKAYNRVGGSNPSQTASVTTEAAIKGLPIWLLYEASQ